MLIGNEVHLDLLFRFDWLCLSTGPALFNSLLWVLTAVSGSLCLCAVVQRARKCLDFTVTFYVLHLLACVWYNGHFPTMWEWWVVTILSATVMTTLGEQLCMQIEMRDIQVKDLFDGFLVPPPSPHDTILPSSSSRTRSRRVSSSHQNHIEMTSLLPPKKMEKRKTSDRTVRPRSFSPPSHGGVDRGVMRIGEL